MRYCLPVILPSLYAKPFNQYSMENQNLNSMMAALSSQERLPVPFPPPISSPTFLCQIGVMIGTYSALQFGKEACRTSPLSGKDYMKELLTSNEQRIHEVLRMPRSTFLDLKQWMIKNGGLQDRKKFQLIN